MRTLTALTIALGLMSCSTLENGTIALVTGEDDPFTEPTCGDGGNEFCGPAPATLVFSEITILGADGGVGDAQSAPTTLSTQAYSGGSMVTLPQIDSENIDILQATVFDSAKVPIIFGQTLPVAVGGIDGLTLDLFIQRKGQFAILPAPLPFSPEAPIAVILEGRYILVASRTSKQALLYDLLLWALVENEDGGQGSTTLPCEPLSIAPIEGTSYMLIICKEGANSTPIGACAPGTEGGAGAGTGGDLVAFQFDYTGQSCTQQVIAPSGSLWSSVAGGATVIAPNGDAFIVGGTRPASLKMPASNQVLKVGLAVANEEAGVSNVYTTFLSPLKASRLGAAALWSTQNAGSVVVLGGNSDATDVGVEYVGDATADGGMGTAGSVNYPGDLTQGAGAALLDATHVLVAGGTSKDGTVAPARIFYLGCSASTCTAEIVGAGGGVADAGTDASLHDGGSHEGGGKDAGAPNAAVAALVPLVTALGFAEPDAATLFIGTGKSNGDTQAFLVSGASSDGGVEASARAVLLRVQTRKGATAILTPIPSVVVVGGDQSMESYIP
jgi:hypothetical protein